MADIDVGSNEIEHDVEVDVPEAELEHEAELEEGDEAADMGTAGSNACEGLPGLAGDTPSGGQPVIAKLLISNAAAGSVIGKVSRKRGNSSKLSAVVTSPWRPLTTHLSLSRSTGWPNH